MIECMAEEMGDLKAKTSLEIAYMRLAQLEVKLETEAAQMVHFQDKYMAMDTLLEKDLQTMDKS